MVFDLVEKYKIMDVDLEQNYFSLTAKSISGLGRDSIRIMKLLAIYDTCYENLNYFDLLASVLSARNEISEQ